MNQRVYVKFRYIIYSLHIMLLTLDWNLEPYFPDRFEVSRAASHDAAIRRRVAFQRVFPEANRRTSY